ncbi:GH92 family glycosyl hydrolase [Aestuariibaculum suncheonense]|uniref:Glycoside hydrolase family 92 protein n=1 Tax=Aestuariibaculum suncheonense TaxID=1028745 RepID=A0A8J6UAB7_9FLAO|nr:GH92 family glycosyl hydrolase [Aestuariibaculum suncheonense]MBD0835078.1 glycoside hydrolase family 92 protein [Aestuariibaculum suncheonense]
MKGFKLLPLVCLTLLSFEYASGQNFKYVDPRIGSEGLGNVFIGPSCPYGMIKPGPDNDLHANSGYTADLDEPIYGFSQTHVSGTGGGAKYGNVSVMPFSGEFNSIKQESLRDNEKIAIGYYGARLSKYDIQTEITTSDRAAFYRFKFNSESKNAVKIDLGRYLDESNLPDGRETQQFVGSQVEVVSNTEVRGYTKIRGGWNNGGAYTVYFSAVFDKPFSNFSTWKDSVFYPNEAVQVDEGEKTGAMLFFDDLSGKIVNMKIGISFISSLKAKQNIDKEIPHWDFEKELVETQLKWEDLLSRVEVDSEATTDQKTMLYTGLYHTMLMPVDRTGENPLWENNGPYYDDFYAIWDTYRSSSPLITLLNPSREVDIVNAMLQIYKRDGYLPDARSGNSNGRTQGGSNAEVVIADAFVKGLKGINYKLGLEAMMKDAMYPPGGNEEKEGRGGLVDYNRLGYVSTDYVRSGNRTVEYAYNDYCLAIVAKGIKRKGEYWRFIKQSDNWQNLWRDIEDNGSRGFIMPKNARGKWVDSIQCAATNGKINYVPYTPLAQDWPNCVCWWCGVFYEASSWEYSLSIPHDVAMLIQKSGGNEAFEKRLNTFFREGFYNVANEPSFLTPNLYHWLGRPDLSSDRIHKIIDENYNAGAAGIPGNDDSGAMSSWLAFHMMGLYPNAGQSYYLINTPYFKETIIHQENGKDFIIKAKNLSSKNKYIKSALLNQKPFNTAFIEHEDIINGGVLELIMSDKPSNKWGKTIVPPSKSDY